MTTLSYLRYRFYRALYRAYAWLMKLPQIEINMDGTRVAFFLLFFAGPVAWFLASLIIFLFI